MAFSVIVLLSRVFLLKQYPSFDAFCSSRPFYFAIQYISRAQYPHLLLSYRVGSVQTDEVFAQVQCAQLSSRFLGQWGPDHYPPWSIHAGPRRSILVGCSRCATAFLFYSYQGESIVHTVSSFLVPTLSIGLEAMCRLVTMKGAARGRDAACRQARQLQWAWPGAGGTTSNWRCELPPRGVGISRLTSFRPPYRRL
jgi:hypothetical protein